MGENPSRLGSRPTGFPLDPFRRRIAQDGLAPRVAGSLPVAGVLGGGRRDRPSRRSSHPFPGLGHSRPVDRAWQSVSFAAELTSTLHFAPLDRSTGMSHRVSCRILIPRECAENSVNRHRPATTLGVGPRRVRRDAEGVDRPHRARDGLGSPNLPSAAGALERAAGPWGESAIGASGPVNPGRPGSRRPDGSAGTHPSPLRRKMVAGRMVAKAVRSHVICPQRIGFVLLSVAAGHGPKSCKFGRNL